MLIKPTSLNEVFSMIFSNSKHTRNMGLHLIVLHTRVACATVCWCCASSPCERALHTKTSVIKCVKQYRSQMFLFQARSCALFDGLRIGKCEEGHSRSAALHLSKPERFRYVPEILRPRSDFRKIEYRISLQKDLWLSDREPIRVPPLRSLSARCVAGGHRRRNLSCERSNGLHWPCCLVTVTPHEPIFISNI